MPHFLLDPQIYEDDISNISMLGIKPKLCESFHKKHLQVNKRLC
jgi:hypothetical protein